MDTALFLHDCCGSGMKMLRSFQTDNPDVIIERVNFFNVYHRKLHELYHFEINDLKKHSFIIYKDQIIKGDA